MPTSDPSDLNLDGIERILVITAHPDDCDFGAAGTIARCTDAGVEVAYCIVTDGDAGGFDETIPRAEMARIRRTEQTAAAAVLGVTDLTFLGYPDGRVTASLDLRRDISRVIRQKRPQRVLCQSPDWNFARIAASHPDHRAAGEAALCAVYPDARNPFAHPELLRDEGLRDWKVASTWIMGGTAPTQVVDVTNSVDRKIETLHCHRSQFETFDGLGRRIREWLAATAARFEMPDGCYAEAFTVVDTA